MSKGPVRWRGAQISAKNPRVTFPAVAEILPHRGPAVVLRAVLCAEQNSIRCATVPLGASYLAREGQVAAIMGLEVLAQAAAAFLGCQGGARPLGGYLVSARFVELKQAHLPPTESLLADVEQIAASGPNASFLARLMSEDGEVYVEAEFLTRQRLESQGESSSSLGGSSP